MRLLIVAAPCVCCCRGSRHYSTSAWHQCLFQFHLIALVIKPGTDTTHHIIALITSKPHCVHMTISLTQTSLLSLTLHLFLAYLSHSHFIWYHRFDPVFHPSHVVVQVYSDKQHLLNNDSFSDHFLHLKCKSYPASGGAVGLVEVMSNGGVKCGFPTLTKSPTVLPLHIRQTREIWNLLSAEVMM